MPDRFLRCYTKGDFVMKLQDMIKAYIGEIEELQQQDYHGKRGHIEITDTEGTSIKGKAPTGLY